MITSAAPKCGGGVFVLMNSNNRVRRGRLAITGRQHIPIGFALDMVRDIGHMRAPTPSFPIGSAMRDLRRAGCPELRWSRCQKLRGLARSPSADGS